MATVGERKHNSQSFLSTSPSPSEFESLSNDRTAELSTHSLPSLHIPWGGIPLVTMQQNETETRCAHCSTRSSSSVLHLVSAGTVLLGDTLQQNSSFVRNNSWPKKVGTPLIYRGRSSLRIPREDSQQHKARAICSLHDFTDIPPEWRLGRINDEIYEKSTLPAQSISDHELRTLQHTRYSNEDTHHNLTPPNPLKHNSLSSLHNEYTPLRDTNSNHSQDEMSFRIHDIARRSSPNLACSSPLLHVKKGNRLEGVDGKLFKTRMSKIDNWFNEFSDVQRNVVLKKLFPLFTTAQVQLLITTMEPFMDPFCMHNCQLEDDL